MFEHSCQSRSDQKDDYLRPISVHSSLLELKEATLSFLKERGFSSIEYNVDYEEAFAERNGFELTISFLKNGDASIDVQLLVHTKRFFGGAKKFLSCTTKDYLSYLQSLA